MPEPRSGLCAVALAGRVVVAGGFPGESDRVDSLDPRTGSWSSEPALPTARVFGAAAVDGSRMLVLGGLRGRDGAPEAYLGSVEAYDAGMRRWQALAPMPTARSRLAAAALGGLVYAAGGHAGQDLAVVEAYDPARDRWSRRADLLRPRHGHALVALADRMYAIGGYAEAPGGGYGPTGSVEEYDPASDRWRWRASMPTPRGFFGAAAMNGRIVVVGGRTLEPAPTEVYDPTLDAWEARGPLPYVRSRFGAVALEGRLYVVGGESRRGAHYRADPTTAVYDPAADRWTQLGAAR
jgi:N-acetylneuraminic acid mutarotase